VARSPAHPGDDARFWIEWIDKLIAQVMLRGHFDAGAAPGGREVYCRLLNSAR